jgi:hypothetical protein
MTVMQTVIPLLRTLVQLSIPIPMNIPEVVIVITAIEEARHKYPKRKNPENQD